MIFEESESDIAAILKKIEEFKIKGGVTDYAEFNVQYVQKWSNQWGQPGPRIHLCKPCGVGVGGSLVVFSEYPFKRAPPGLRVGSRCTVCVFH